MNEMKIIGVAILAVLGVAQVDGRKSSFEEVKLNIDSSFTCKVKCALKCEPYESKSSLYSKCLTVCGKKCDQIFINFVNNYITSCNSIKNSL